MTEQLRSHDQVAIKGDIVKEDLDQIELNLSEFSPKIKDKTFVVSGGAGFLGSWFSDAAIRMGGRVVCVDNLIAGSQKSILHLKDHPNFQFVEEDITEFSRVSPDFSH